MIGQLKHYLNGLYPLILTSVKLNTIKNVKNDNNGNFFKYLIDSSIPESVKSYLERLQIFESLNNC